MFGWYKRNLLQNRNYGRWMEYSISSSLMIVLITMICGVTDLAAMIAIFGVNACMILFGLLMEKYENPGKPSWLSFWFGSFAGIIPWIAVVIYVWSPGFERRPPPWIRVRDHCVILRVLQQLRRQHGPPSKKVGRWRDYLFGEKTYILLSLTSKALLAWLVFANTLIP